MSTREGKLTLKTSPDGKVRIEKPKRRLAAGQAKNAFGKAKRIEAGYRNNRGK